MCSILFSVTGDVSKVYECTKDYEEFIRSVFVAGRRVCWRVFRGSGRHIDLSMSCKRLAVLKLYDMHTES
jgi:hypothetical protein